MENDLEITPEDRLEIQVKKLLLQIERKTRENNMLREQLAIYMEKVTRIAEVVRE